MAKAISGAKKQNRIDLQNLSPRDVNFLTLETKDLMKMYKVEKQAVHNRRFALNKKLREAGLTAEEVLANAGHTPEPEAEVKPKKSATRKPRTKKAKPQDAAPEKAETPPEEKISESREVMVVNKQMPVIMKPIEINFDNFSIKLNGVPKKISVNPDTNAIEIDL